MYRELRKVMKKLAFLTFVLFFFVSQSFAYYSRTTKNGGPNGYNKTQKVVGNGNTTISCEGPGYDSCPHIFKQSPETDNDPNIDNADFLLNLVIQRIQLGELTGTEVYNGLMATWSSDNVNMTNSDILIQ